jgi:nitroreductase
MTTREQGIVDAAIRSRRSIRAFLPRAVAREDIEAILEVAAHAPSGTNTQPWKVHVLTNAIKERLSAELLRAHNDPATADMHTEEYPYYPRKWVYPYLERRRKVGWDLYSLLGLTREDKAGMHAQHGRNYLFFDAPVGLIFTIDCFLEQGSWLDYGMFLQNLMVAARGRRLDACPQAAFNKYHKIIREILQIPPEQAVVCGMSLGYADPARIENTLLSEREPVATFACFHE